MFSSKTFIQKKLNLISFKNVFWRKKYWKLLSHAHISLLNQIWEKISQLLELRPLVQIDFPALKQNLKFNRYLSQ